MSDQDSAAPSPRAISRLTPEKITTENSRKRCSDARLAALASIARLDGHDEQVELVLDLVRDLVLGGEMQVERAVELARLV